MDVDGGKNIGYPFIRRQSLSRSVPRKTDFSADQPPTMNAYGERLTTRQIFMKALKKTWEKFAQRTMIHGVRYINDRNGNKYTK